MSKPTCEKNFPCLSLVGMPGSGKTTIGKILAKRLDWAFMDSDNLVEALYGARLQSVADALDKERFLDMECAMIRAIRASRCVIATGGSVVYRPEAIKHLESLGPVVCLRVSLQTAMDRIAAAPDRGLALGPGQTIADIYEERKTLYASAAKIACVTDAMPPEECADWILKSLPADFNNGMSRELKEF